MEKERKKLSQKIYNLGVKKCSLLSMNYEIKNRKLKYSKFRDFIAQTSVVKGIKSN